MSKISQHIQVEYFSYTQKDLKKIRVLIYLVLINLGPNISNMDTSLPVFDTTQVQTH